MRGSGGVKIQSSNSTSGQHRRVEGSVLKAACGVSPPGSDNMHSSKTTMKRFLTNWITCWTAASLAWLACGAIPGQAAEPQNSELDVVRVRPNFYMIAGAGGNIGVQIGSDGVLLVASGNAASSTDVSAAIQAPTHPPVR